MILAILLGIVLQNSVGTPKLAKPGVVFSLRRVLRFAIILLGLQLTAEQIVEVGAAGIAVIAATLIGTFLFTTWLGRMIGVDRKLTRADCRRHVDLRRVGRDRHEYRHRRA